MAKKKDNLCFDVSSLDQDQKVTFAKSLKKTVESFNKELETIQSNEDQDNES